MIDKIEKTLCTGCNSCYNACPQDTITMIKDQEGFWYPKVEGKKCTKCGICISSCPSLNEYTAENNTKSPQVFAAWSKDEQNRFYSTSGGIFTELAKVILQQGGYVIGAQYSNKFLVEHAAIDKISDIPKLRQSKYLQSDIGDVYKQALELLELGKTVMFCGTPCQNAGLSVFLGRDYNNLIKCDFICRGVISPMVFRKYLDMLEKRYDQPIKKVTFKNKSRGWNGFCTLIEFEDGKQYIEDRNNDLYMVGYLKYNLYMRPSCHECKYKKIPRVSDITLGDFWGIGNTRPHLDENKGTSVVLLNSDKGKDLFAKIEKEIIFEGCTLDEALRGNPCLLKSAPIGKHREMFFKHLLNEPFDIALLNAVNEMNPR